MTRRKYGGAVSFETSTPPQETSRVVIGDSVTVAELLSMAGVVARTQARTWLRVTPDHMRTMRQAAEPAAEGFRRFCTRFSVPEGFTPYWEAFKHGWRQTLTEHGLSEGHLGTLDKIALVGPSHLPFSEDSEVARATLGMQGDKPALDKYTEAGRTLRSPSVPPRRVRGGRGEGEGRSAEPAEQQEERRDHAKPRADEAALTDTEVG